MLLCWKCATFPGVTARRFVGETVSEPDRHVWHPVAAAAAPAAAKQDYQQRRW